MLQLDGAMGEGGGQVLRTALGLSLATGQPFRIENIRANRAKPGLRRQHLTAVLAAAEVGGADVEGAQLESTALAFRPRRARAGDYAFDVGTAGSTTLVLQAVLPGLLVAEEPSTVRIRGGTHNPLAPPFEFLQLAFAPVLTRMGCMLGLELERAGFHPAGGGALNATVGRVGPLRTFDLTQRPSHTATRARVLLANLPRHVGDREAAVLRDRLALSAADVVVEDVPSSGPGNAVLVTLALGETVEVVSALGAAGVPAERVAGAAAAEAQALLAARVPVGSHLADQLLIPMALAGGGVFRTTEPTLHTRTNAQVIERFLPVRFAIREDGAQPGTWLVELAR